MLCKFFHSLIILKAQFSLLKALKIYRFKGLFLRMNIIVFSIKFFHGLLSAVRICLSNISAMYEIISQESIRPKWYTSILLGCVCLCCRCTLPLSENFLKIMCLVFLLTSAHICIKMMTQVLYRLFTISENNNKMWQNTNLILSFWSLFN